MVRNLMMIFGLTLAVAAFGCSDDSSNAAGSGGSGGSGGGGGAGEGGAGGAGEGGGGGAGEGGAPGSGIAPACDNEADIAAGDVDVTACTTAAATTNKEYCGPPTGTGTDSSGLATCYADDGNTQSAACLDCWADLSCCTLNECSVFVGGPCLAAPEPGDPCDLCIQEKCQPAFDSCGAE